MGEVKITENVTREHLRTIKPVSFPIIEKDLENHIIDNIHTINNNNGWPEIKQVKQQFCLSRLGKRCIIDILIVHKDNSITIIEVKKHKRGNRGLSVIGQILSYGYEFRETIKDVRLVIAIPYFNNYLYSIIKNSKLEIDLLCISDEMATYLPANKTIDFYEVQQ